MMTEDNKFQKELTLEEKSIIIMEVNKVLNSGFRILGFDGGVTFPHYPYHFYFGDPDKELRRYSVGIFTIWLGYWNTGCSFRFTKQSELYKYIKTLIEYQEEIEKEFPASFNYIVFFLMELTENYRYIEETRMKPYIIEIVKNDFLKTKTNYREMYIQKLNFIDFLKELKVQDYDKPYE
ncbi:carbamoyl-phosphate synthase small subunit [Solibacillus sp. MA9]|uniref:Carbamoyl-phosphate synthase small subunit n=1 Tax=Solibacillus palustris TaxID=2908203 RepID=A0ABS9UFL2_9BACL|nr:carbamoyl-phosphate synthase small subunit [Solibacillus sp. MA9]MCH7323132.1 carbamoyl-phosphate synthase small subunit [Solibacillus sp. MA9]